MDPSRFPLSALQQSSFKNAFPRNLRQPAKTSSNPPDLASTPAQTHLSLPCTGIQRLAGVSCTCKPASCGSWHCSKPAKTFRQLWRGEGWITHQQQQQHFHASAGELLPTQQQQRPKPLSSRRGENGRAPDLQQRAQLVTDIPALILGRTGG